MSQHSIEAFEFTATEARIILQDIFPARKLVLSQLTFFNQNGVGSPSGSKVIRGRRCYRIFDLLPIALMLALKEQGIPNKNVVRVPSLIKEHSSYIFSLQGACQISGIGDLVHLSLPGSDRTDVVLECLLSGGSGEIFWSFDVGGLAREMYRVTERLVTEGRFETSIHDSQSEASFHLKLAAG
jgi:hypothetical protein